MDKFIFFFKTSHPFSQWYRCKFDAEGLEFNCAEQFMMYKKAVLFNDFEKADLIMKTTEPRKQKEIGRKVSNFDQKIWLDKSESIVFEGNYNKFHQNHQLRRLLLDTSDSYIVEASPTDTVWGIGLAETDPKRFDKTNWRGKNLLGEILMKVRTTLREK